MKRRVGSILRLLDVMARVPVISVGRASRETGIVPSSVSAALVKMAELGMVRELTGWKRNRLFCYGRYLDVLSEGTEPLA